jgi:hypothetical protein
MNPEEKGKLKLSFGNIYSRMDTPHGNIEN